MTVPKPTARRRTEKTRTPGIYRYHARECSWLTGGSKCSCPASYQATAYSRRDGKLIRKHFTTLGAAKTWREDANQAIRAGTLKAPIATTVAQALDAYAAGMEDGSILDRSGKPYKPATCRRYARAARLYLKPAIGRVRLSDLRRRDVQALVEELRRGGAAPSTVHNTLDPLRAVYRRALHLDEVSIDPTARLALPAVRGGRDRIADPAEAEALLAALPEPERALWATALYTGARRGELRALRWSDVDLDGGTIRIERALDDGERGKRGELVEVKTAAGRRTVPIVPALRKLLAAHKLATGRGGEDLVFGRSARGPFIPSTVRRRALTAWGWKDVPNPDAGGPKRVWIEARPDALAPIGLHECRHTAASLLIDAGVNDKALSSIMGHASVTITKDRYGHLMPDGVAEAGRLLAARLDRASAADHR